ncbi:MAG: phosphoenolpyruvate--protein phosphotransferase, partial [Actinomycetota bacterium]
MPGENRLEGLGVSPGIAQGPLVAVTLAVPSLPEVDDPHGAVRSAVAIAEADLTALAAQLRDAGRDEGAEVVSAQALMAGDPMLVDGIVERLDAGSTLDAAVTEAADALMAMLRGLDDPYLAQRADDIGEVAARVRRILAGVESADLSHFTEPVVLVADSLTAAETAQLDPRTVLGFATETGGPTSHVVIIARALGVPAVVGAEGLMGSIGDANVVALDGATGDVVFDPTSETTATFDARAEAHAAAVALAAEYRGRSVAYGDRPMAIAANAASEADVDRAIAEEADGIGLLRTEFLYFDRSDAPSEDEQYALYAKAAAGFGEAVTVRTFDIGGDKPAECVSVPDEENPFLGLRGARIYRSHPELFETQIRAALRAAAVGPINLMLPMISTVAEIIDLRGWIEEIAAGLDADGIEHAMPPIGVMIEVPAIALIADAVMPHVDFVSIGSNDLTQYTLAADRMHAALGHMQDPMHPSVLALCMFTATAARSAGVPSSVCGLAAADPLAAAAFAAMGIDKLSVSAPQVNARKAGIDDLDPAGGHAAVDAALAAADAAEARAAIAGWI